MVKLSVLVMMANLLNRWVPMLTVLEKQGLTNVVAVVTRYFGGIKLGAGGLIRAYSGSVAHAIEEIGRVEIKRG